MSETNNYLSFRVGAVWYGVSIDTIIEVLYLVGLTELPGAKPEILGLLTLRDTILPIVDLRRHFGLPAVLKLDSPIIALQTAKGPIGLVVDDVKDVEEAATVTAYAGGDTPYVTGAIKYDDRLLLLLNVTEIRDAIQVQATEGIAVADAALFTAPEAPAAATVAPEPSQPARKSRRSRRRKSAPETQPPTNEPTA